MAGDHADDALARLRRAELEPGEAGRRGRLAEQPFLTAERAPGAHDLGVVDRHDGAARLRERLLDLGAMDRVGDADRRSERRRALRRLDRMEPRQRAGGLR